MFSAMLRLVIKTPASSAFVNDLVVVSPSGMIAMIVCQGAPGCSWRRKLIAASGSGSMTFPLVLVFRCSIRQHLSTCCYNREPYAVDARERRGIFDYAAMRWIEYD